ncbi:hypothetical protein XENTR_v10020797 [Xenopus tropicalis]|nr:hypothetical protein XENTR_v10020797 [Xenopus tropicalis]
MGEHWYHADMSQAWAEHLLIRDGRDGAFLVRQSESVNGAFAICLMYQHMIHTYRVLPDDCGLLSVQSVQGVDVKKFEHLSDLVYEYMHKQNGLITALQYPVGCEAELSTEQVNDYVETMKSPGWKDISYTGTRIVSCQRGMALGTQRTLLQEDVEDTRKQGLGLFHLSPLLEKQCRELDREIGVTWNSLRVLTKVFGQMISDFNSEDEQMLDRLMNNISAVHEIIASLENKVVQTLKDSLTSFATSPASRGSMSPRVPVTATSNRTGKTDPQDGLQQDRNQPKKNCPKSLSLFVGTWNMGGSPPPRSISSWLSSRGLGRSLEDTGPCVSHDLYMVGTQENPQGDREWAEFLRLALISHTGKQFKVVSMHSLGGVKLVLLVKQEYESLISHVQISSVRTGMSNTLGHRGAVGASLDFCGISLGFVTCHLVSGNEKVQKRNQSYGEILRGLTLGDESLKCFQLPLRLTHLFWAGDLNYRLSMPLQDILQCVYSGRYQVLLPVDQLSQERERKKIFLGFKEDSVTFPPTCRYERGTRSYDLHKARTTGTRLFAPCWSDRVLWTSYPDTDIKCTSYGCTEDIVTSDHSPVFATFEVGLDCTSQQDTSCTVRFQSIEAIIKTQSRSKGFIEFRSVCMRGSPQSKENSTHSTEGSAFLKLGWSDLDLPEITLVGQDRRSALTRHILFNIRSTDGGESYGECCVSVNPLNSGTDHHFQAFLSQRGEETGSIRGWVIVSRFLDVNPLKSPNTLQGDNEKGLSSVRESSSLLTCAPVSPRNPSASQLLARTARRRPASLCCVMESYSNAEYFLFEGMPSTPTSPRPHSALVSGDHQSSGLHGRQFDLRPEMGKNSALVPISKPSKATSRSVLY